MHLLSWGRLIKAPLILFFLLALYSPWGLTQTNPTHGMSYDQAGTPSRNSNQPIVLNVEGVNGQNIQIIEDRPWQIYDDLYTDPDGARWTVTNYGSRVVSYYAFMAAAEMFYCMEGFASVIKLNEETPNCWDEIETMMLDPGMRWGVLTMAATSIFIYRNGDRVLRRFFDREMRRVPGGRYTPGSHPALKALAISRTVLQHVAMGVGMMNLTIVSSTWHNPFLRQCLSQIRPRIRQAMRQFGENITSRQVTTALNQGQDNEDCRNSKRYFMDAEDGTRAELAITALSLAAAMGLSATAVSTIRMVGMTLLKGHPVGRWLTGGGIAIAHVGVELADSLLERIIRQAYHRYRARRLLNNHFSNLVENLNQYQQTSQLTVTEEEQLKSPLLDSLLGYKSNIDYRRRALLNRFIEGHVRWKQKVTNTFSNLAVFQNMMRRLYEAREDYGTSQEADHDLKYVGVGHLPESEVIEPRPGSAALFTQQQLHGINEVIDFFLERIPDEERNRNYLLRRTLVDLRGSIEGNDKPATRVYLWRLKTMLTDQYMYRTTYNSSQIMGSFFTNDEIDWAREILVDPFSSMTTEEAYAARIFERREIYFFENHSQNGDAEEFVGEASEGGVDPEELESNRRGLLLTGGDPLETLFAVNKDDPIEHRNSDHDLTFHFLGQNMGTAGIDANSVPSRILSHLACSDFSEMNFYYNRGRSSRLAFPNILADPGKINCYPRFRYGNSLDRFWSPESDYITDPQTTGAEPEHIQIDPTFHNLYVYDGVPHIGLFELMIDPRTELRWNTQAEFDEYWREVMWPQVMAWMVQVKEGYFEHLNNRFEIGEVRSNCQIFSHRMHWCNNPLCPQARLNMDFKGAITQDEVIHRSRRGSDVGEADVTSLEQGHGNHYYQGLNMVETFIDEVRTYAYAIEKVTGSTEDPDRQLLLSLIPELEQLIELLDISDRRLNRRFRNLNTEQMLEFLSEFPLMRTMGRDKAVAFSDSHISITDRLESRLLELEDSGINYSKIRLQDGQINPEITQLSPADVVKYSSLKYTMASLEYALHTLVHEYLSGAKIVYIGEAGNIIDFAK